jgi:hypothetical protein
MLGLSLTALWPAAAWNFSLLLVEKTTCKELNMLCFKRH